MLSIIFLKIITFITWSKILINIVLPQMTLDKILAISRWQFNQTTHGESDQVAIKMQCRILSETQPGSVAELNFARGGGLVW